MVQITTISAPPFCEREALRFAGCREADAETTALLAACFEEVKEQLHYRVCFAEVPVTIAGDVCDFGAFRLCSRALAKTLDGCERSVLFGATLGVEIDRLIAKYGRLSPAKALMLQAIGAERIESLCDAFCVQYREACGEALTMRFSPGYGDLPLSAQRELFAALDLPRKIGLTLNDSLIMSPTKSVTAIVGVGAKAPVPKKAGCARCDKRDCAFRSENV